MTNKNHKPSEYLAIAFYGRLVGHSPALIAANQRKAARRGELLTVTHRTDFGNWETNANAYARFVAETSATVSEMERVARSIESSRVAAGIRVAG